MATSRGGLQGLLSMLALLLTAADARATTFIDTFDDFQNAGGWHFGADQIVREGGNPAWYLSATGLDVPTPFPHTHGSSVFTGDYRNARVVSVGVDLITTYIQWGGEAIPLAVVLRSNNGTPADYSDDWAAYRLGEKNFPLPGDGWLRYQFEIPSASTALPAGWALMAIGMNAPPNPDWNDLITDVSSLGFCFGDPTWFYIFQLWDVGLDNAQIDFDPAVAVPEGVRSASWGRVKSAFR